MIYGYMRVSTLAQTKGNSLEEQKNALQMTGAENFFTDTYSGKTTDRPALNDLLSQLQKGDIVVVAKLDRLARNVVDGIALIKSLLDRGVKVQMLDMGIVDDTATGQLILTVMLAFAEFERNRIRERTTEGKAIAKTKAGFKEGRPQKFTENQLQHAISLLGNYTYKEVVAMTQISESTLLRHKKSVNSCK